MDNGDQVDVKRLGNEGSRLTSCCRKTRQTIPRQMSNLGLTFVDPEITFAFVHMRTVDKAGKFSIQPRP